MPLPLRTTERQRYISALTEGAAAIADAGESLRPTLERVEALARSNGRNKLEDDCVSALYHLRELELVFARILRDA